MNYSFFTNKDIHFKLIELDDRRRCFIADVLVSNLFFIIEKKIFGILLVD
ncbi:hypothetical protein [Candidatus Phytoplasma sacchari]|uniref:Uncharacterized protein n=1 Tax=Candidatus Phytoplasma sacchari TaxID=2609813 RepID=A0ABY7M0Q0_9MOLU|nr:hypothetical protein O7R10_01680 [Candidatus Phytoplasma sacchari]